MSNYIEKIRFNKDFRSYREGDLFDFRPGVNLIVGDQGCGKSSLFYSIMNWQESGIAMRYDQTKSYMFLDTETMNPRLKDSFEAHRDFETVREAEKAEFDHAINSLLYDYKEQSHGQIMLPLIMAAKDPDKTYFIDEPEAGLSIRSQYKIAEHFREMAKHGQLIVATHSMVIMEEFGEVLSLEHKKWMSTAEFVETQKKWKD